MPRQVQRVDPEQVLREVAASSDGWRFAPISYGEPRPGQPGVEGLVDPEGRAWEIARRGPITGKARAELGKYVATQRLAGYEFRLLELGGETFLAERFRDGTQLRPWDGIRLLDTSWHIDGPCPWQGSMPVEWVHPGGLVVEQVTLYVRHRSWGVDPAGALWQGHVQRYDHRRGSMFDAIRCPWSPNLLPTLAPRDVPPAEEEPKGEGILFQLFQPRRPEPPEVGFLENESEKACKALVEKATAWLRERGTDPEAWDPGFAAG